MNNQTDYCTFYFTLEYQPIFFRFPTDFNQIWSNIDTVRLQREIAIKHIIYNRERQTDRDRERQRQRERERERERERQGKTNDFIISIDNKTLA